MMSEKNLLEVRHLTTAFESEVGLLRAVDDVSFNVPRGQCVGIVGESGCGKSVTAMSLVRLLPRPHGQILEGRVMFDGEDILQMRSRRLHEVRGGRIGVIFQEPMSALNPVHRIGDQIAESLMLHRGMNRETAWLEAINMLHHVRIPDPEARVWEFPSSLSGGMRQRVALARSLAPNPKILLMDEPFSALDAMTREQLYGDIQDIWAKRKKTIVFVTHNVREAVCLGSRVVLFSPHPGRVREEFSVDLSRPRNINNHDLADLSQQITSSLKGYQNAAESD